MVDGTSSTKHRLPRRRASTKPQHSVIGVSADPHAGTEDWSQEFSSHHEHAAVAAGATGPSSPASRRKAALERIAKEECAPHPRQRHPQSTVVMCSARVGGAPADVPSRTHATAPPPPTLKPPNSRSGATFAGSSNNSNPTAASSSRRQRRDHRSSGGGSAVDGGGRTSSQWGREDAGGKTSSSRSIKPRQQHHESSSRSGSSRRGSHADSARSSHPGPRSTRSSTTAAGVGGRGELRDEVTSGSSSRPKYRRGSGRGRDDKDTTAGSRHLHSSSAGTGGSVSVGKAARPWEDYVEEMNDSPAGSAEDLPAPQPRSLGGASTDANEGRKVSLVWQLALIQYVHLSLLNENGKWHTSVISQPFSPLGVCRAAVRFSKQRTCWMLSTTAG